MTGPFDKTAAVQWVRTDTTPSKSGYYYQRDSLGRKFGTKSQLVASLALKYCEAGKWCRPLVSWIGFDFYTLIGMEEATAPVLPTVSPDAHLGATE